MCENAPSNDILNSVERAVILYGAEEVLARVDSSALGLRVATDLVALRSALEDAENVRVPLVLNGVPQWVEAVIGPDSVSVRREGVP